MFRLISLAFIPFRNPEDVPQMTRSTELGELPKYELGIDSKLWMLPDSSTPATIEESAKTVELSVTGQDEQTIKQYKG